MASGTVRRQIDVITFLSSVVQENTSFYRSDFDRDISTLRNAVMEKNMADRSFYWMSRRSGTWCLKEREVYLRNTGAFSIWTHYADEADPVRAYRVVITGCRNGTVIGDVYELDYGQQVKRVRRDALPVHLVTLSFADGSIMTMLYDEYCRDRKALTAQHGDILDIDWHPENEATLTKALMLEHRFQAGQGQKGKRKTRTEANPITPATAQPLAALNEQVWHFAIKMPLVMGQPLIPHDKMRPNLGHILM